MSRDIRETLKNNLPEFLKTYPELLEFLDAAGEFLNETKSEIEDFDYSHDYKKSTEYGLSQRLKSIGFEIPLYIDKNTSRTVLRDGIEAFLKKGTTDSLLWVLKIIGTTPTIRQAWLPSPNEVRNGKKVNLNTGDEERYDITKFTYTDFLYGSAVTNENGTFFRGYSYFDPFEEQPIENIPILGEFYKEAPEYITPVEKMPYIIVRIKDQDFNIVTEPYTDPATGEVYEYGLSEEYRAVENLIEYFLYQLARPATVRIIVVASVHLLEDIISTEDEVFETWTHDDTTTEDIIETISPYTEIHRTPPHRIDADSVFYHEDINQTTYKTEPEHEVSDSLSVSSDIRNFAERSITGFFVGDPIITGEVSPYLNFYEGISGVKVGEGGIFEIIPYDMFSSLVGIGTTATFENGFSRKIPVRGVTSVVIPPNSGEITIHALSDFSDTVSTERDIISVVNTNSTEVVQIPLGYHGFFLWSTTSNMAINIGINYE